MLKVYDENEEVEYTTRLRLRDTSYGVEVIAVDERGDRIESGTILTISEEGITRRGWLNKKVGIARESTRSSRVEDISGDY